MASGIYGIHNTVTDKWYVGQAVNIRARWNAHKSMLSRNERESIHLLRAWQKYGPDAFEWVILEECSPEILDEREKYSYHWEYADEDRPTKYGSRQIKCVETGKVYQSVQQAATELNINRSSISNALRGKSQKAGGFHWTYLSGNSKDM